MRKWIAPFLICSVVGLGLTSSSCAKSGCPAEIQSKKIKKKKSLNKSAKTNLWPKKMRKNVRNPKF